MYYINVQVSDQAGYNLKMYRVVHNMTNTQALDDILLKLSETKDDDKTTITIPCETADRIRKLGNMGDSYDTVINRVFDELHKVKVRDDE